MQLTVSVTEGVYLLDSDEIICLEACSNYTRLHLTGQRKIFSARTLKYYEISLTTENFFRVHSSYLVNIKHISFLDLRGELCLSQGLKIKVAKRRKAVIPGLLKVV